MKIPVEPACYVWVPRHDADIAYPVQAFVEGVLWLESFFEWNQHCRVPMTAELRTAVSRLFPYAHVSAERRLGPAQELVSTILRLLDRVRVDPVYDFRLAELGPLGDSLVRREPVYSDEDVWLSWCDLLAQCVAELHQPLHGVAARINSCVESERGNGGELFRWLYCGDGNSLPDGVLDPAAMISMKQRWCRCERPVVWEDSGHQPPLAVKRVIGRIVDGCEGVILRFGSIYFNPSMSTNCSVTSGGNLNSQVSELLCTVSDGKATIRGVFRTTAETSAEQLAALSFVRRVLQSKCSEAGFRVDE